MDEVGNFLWRVLGVSGSGFLEVSRLWSGCLTVLSSFLMTWFSISSLIISYCGYVVSRDCEPPIMIRSMDTDRMATRHKSRFSLNSNSQVWHSKSKYYPSIFYKPHHYASAQIMRRTLYMSMVHTVRAWVNQLILHLLRSIWFKHRSLWLNISRFRPNISRFRPNIGQFWLYPWI